MKRIQRLLLWLLFEIIAVILWKSQDNLFYFFNFTYIGTALSVGLYLFKATSKNPIIFNFL
ncbi:MAG: hypothetical protein ACK5LY_03335 [Lachnospirales bacterium]